jgi:hypothetical protein
MMGNTTLTSNFVQTALFMRLLDELLGTPVLERIDWSVKFMQFRERKREDVRNALVRLYPDLPCPIDPPLFPLGAYAGQYRHAGYGDMKFELCGDALVASRLLHEISMVIRMTHATGEFWMARLEIVNQDPRDHEIVRAEFQRTEDGIARRIGLDLEPALRGQMIWFDSITS